MTRLTGRNYPKLEEACAAFGIKVTHKHRMNEKAVKFKSNEAFKKQALTKAKELVKEKGWSLNYAYDRVLDKMKEEATEEKKG